MAINPTREQIEAVAQIAGTDSGGPLVMLNLNRYRERAAYASAPPGGVGTDVTGREAYERYATTALRVLARVGGDVLWQAHATHNVRGHGRARTAARCAAAARRACRASGSSRASGSW